MAGNQVITVKEADGVTETDVEVLGMGRQGTAASKSIQLCTEDKAVLDSLATKLDTAITALQVIDNMVLQAGTANIGDVDVLTLAGQAPAFGSGAAGATVLRVLSATNDPIVAAITGSVADGDADAGNSSKVAGVAVAHGANPTADAAGDRAPFSMNRHRIPFTIGGHPNIINNEHVIAGGDPKTNFALLTITAGLKIVLTQICAKCDPGNSGNTVVRVGFGTATVPAVGAAGVAAVGVPISGSFPANGGHQLGNGSAIVAVGADGEDLRVTCTDPVAGNVRITYSYYTIES